MCSTPPGCACSRPWPPTSPRATSPDQILVLEHNPVFTLGRNASRQDIHVADPFLRGARGGGLRDRPGRPGHLPRPRPDRRLPHLQPEGRPGGRGAPGARPGGGHDPHRGRFRRGRPAPAGLPRRLGGDPAGPGEAGRAGPAPATAGSPPTASPSTSPRTWPTSAGSPPAASPTRGSARSSPCWATPPPPGTRPPTASRPTWPRPAGAGRPAGQAAQPQRLRPHLATRARAARNCWSCCAPPIRASGGPASPA